ncbi:sperm flagellar protein 1-like [Suncus etruscus]|uniref:sperm flagellar protein 1-like n=1 Tax=Suncus etruscus TaxID=109475 RepID=UPI0021102BAC|nr:sperm flagellar protein 1-like [Suncus etruscus]
MLGAARPSPPAPTLPAPALQRLYAWLDRLPLSRPKRHVARDFSDGVLLAEIVKLFHPRLVDLHNYVPTCNTQQKLDNWRTLGRKVLSKLKLWVSEADIQRVVANTPGAIEPILCVLREKMESAAVHEDLPLALLEEKEQALAILQETVKEPWLPPPLLVRQHQCPVGALEMEPLPTSPGEPRCLLSNFTGPQLYPILQIKVLKLEHLVRLKDLRIEELMEHGDTAWTPQPCPGSPGPATCMEQGGRGLRPNEL